MIAFTAALCVLTGLALFYGVWQRYAARLLAAEQVRTMRRIAQLETEVGTMVASAVPVSSAMMALAVKKLTHLHTPEMDALMVKLGPPYRLDDDEAERLKVMLRERAQDTSDPLVDDEERETALMLPFLINQVHRDRLRTGLNAEPLIRLLVVSDTVDNATAVPAPITVPR